MENPIRYVAGISWPRSGHHVVQRLLQAYFGPEFVYCAFYESNNRLCCRTFPCSRGDVHFSKNHDFSGETPAPGVPHFIQYRAPAQSIISSFELHLTTGRPDTIEEFERFAMAWAHQWGVFVAKWVDADLEVERHILRYEDFVANSAERMAEVVRFFAPNAVVDRGRLTELVTGEYHQFVDKTVERWVFNAGIREQRQLESFRYYTPGLFAEIEAVATRSRFSDAATMRIGGRT